MKLDADQQRLVTDHLWLAHQIATSWEARYSQRPIREEFRSAAYAGLCDAASRYTDDRRVEFRVYARPWIHGAILDEIRNELPKTFRIKRHRGDRPVPNVVSLRRPVVADEEEVGLALEAIDEVYDLTRFLTSQEATVVRDYYCTCLTMEQIGRKYRLGEPRISQIHRHAIAELQRQMERYA